MKKFILIPLVALVLTGCSILPQKQIQIPQQTSQEFTTSSQNQQAETPNDTKFEETKNKIPAQAKKNTSTNYTNSGDQEFDIFTLIVNGETYTQPFIEGKNIYQLMQGLVLSPAKYFNFKAKEYPGIGYFVQEINGLKENVKDKMYWIYYINGQPAQIGISDYIIQQGDIIEWKYEKAKF